MLLQVRISFKFYSRRSKTETIVCFGLILHFIFCQALRHQRLANPGLPPPAVIYTSTTAVYGRPPPAVVVDSSPHTPEGSYGTAKAMMELYISDMHRRDF